MEIRGKSVYFGGVALQELVNRFGTPLYVYDGAKMVSQLNRLRRAFTIPHQIKYAIKALPSLSVLKWLRKHEAGADAVSIQEVKLALHAGFLPHEIMFSPNCAPFEETTAAVQLGVQVNVDNLPFLEQFGKLFGRTYPCAIRLNPHIKAGGNEKISVGHSDSKFGISILQLDEIKKIVHRYNMQINGLHIHTGSDIADADVYLKMADIFFSVLDDFPDVVFLDFGSGFKVPYREGDASLNIEELGAKLSNMILDYSHKKRRMPELWLEPGKFLVSEAGWLLATCTVVKETPSRTFVGLNTGLNHLIRPMMYGAYHHIVNVSNPADQPENYTVVGYICETDTFGTDRMISKVREGDVLAICNAGAYGYSMASNYNARLRPAEVLVINGEPHLIRKSDTWDDLLRGQVVIDL
ncbi:MAG: diaminopimelate decarboxylase [Cyclobacteriaceae bacterium]|nr:diaminopimelate decarboxylase [Cyclobacteriaceae bacterium]MCX7636401.1 diaminopimelate decarboxylase [Cyclobacteriaceae bacterium]MDW8330844.1 diaminopimelate decarboxylase [Cyclobacteriaceae bacterium]